MSERFDTKLFRAIDFIPLILGKTVVQSVYKIFQRI